MIIRNDRHPRGLDVGPRTPQYDTVSGLPSIGGTLETEVYGPSVAAGICPACGASMPMSGKRKTCGATMNWHQQTRARWRRLGERRMNKPVDDDSLGAINLLTADRLGMVGL